MIDALDECEGEDDITTILRLLGQAKSTTNLRIYLTSIPELPLRLGFANMAAELHHDIVLHEIAKETLEHDINIFLERRFAHIREEFIRRQPTLGVAGELAWS